MSPAFCQLVRLHFVFFSKKAVQSRPGLVETSSSSMHWRKMECAFSPSRITLGSGVPTNRIQVGPGEVDGIVFGLFVQAEKLILNERATAVYVSLSVSC